MFKPFSFLRSHFPIGAISAVMLFSVTGLSAQPSQSPLLSRPFAGAAPNLVLNLDDSGSMMYQHSPEGSFVLGGKTITLAGDNSMLLHPSDTRNFPGTFRGYWSADTSATGPALVYQMQARSPDVNLLYYNPATTYRPWIAKDPSSLICASPKTYCDASRFPNANLLAASFNPQSPAVPAAAAPTAITFVGAGAAVSKPSGNVTPELPVFASGDFLICLAESYDRASHGVSTPGWTPAYNIDSGAGSTHRASAIYKIAAAAEANPTITHTSGSTIVSRCFAYRNVDAVTSIESGSTSIGTVNTDKSIDAASATTVSANTMVLLAAHQANAFNAPAFPDVRVGWTWALDGSAKAGTAGTNGAGIAMYSATRAAIGATGAFVVTSPLGQRNSGVLLVLRKKSATALSGGADLTAAATSITSNWCTTASSGCPSAAKSYTPMLIYRLQKDTGGAFLAPDNSANYTTINLTTAVAGSTYTHPTRTECTAGVCTLEQEKQNYANWFVYHRSRLLIAQASIAESFWSLDEKDIRLAWGHIHKGPAVLDNGETVSTVVSPLRPFTDARKDGLFSFVRNIPVQSGTPLRTALQGVGEYYSKESPWADDPSNVALGTPKDCRRAYHLLITDGLWNGTTPTMLPLLPPSTPLPSGRNLDNLSDAENASTYPTITSSSTTSWTYTRGAPYSDNNEQTLADWAHHYFARDLRPTLNNNVVVGVAKQLFWQGMINFTVSLGLTGNLDPKGALPTSLTDGPPKGWGTNRVDDLWHAAVNSEGSYFSTRNSDELAGALKTALKEIDDKEVQEAGVATASNILEAGNRKYIPLYLPGVWTGDIRSFALDADGVTAGSGLKGGEIWSANERMKPADWASRNIYTWNSDATAPSLFTWATMGSTNQAAIGPDTGTEDLVNYLRGDSSNESATLFRKRDSRLGDFINSNPVLVKKGADLGYQSLSLGGSTYDTYRSTTKANRHGVLFVGANDGMVHAFKDSLGKVNPTDLAEDPTKVAGLSDGKEIFAYVPKAVYGNLSKLADKTYGTAPLYHQFFVDGALTETDAYVKATATASTAEWRNYLTGSLSAGARAVFAFDVTDMTAPGADNIKWEFSNANDSDLGHVSAPIEVGVLKDNTWVAIFGNGPYSTDGKAALFVLNLETGASTKLVVDSGSGNGLGGVGVQRDTEGYITNLFAGDLKGSLWKFDYDAAATSKFVISGGSSAAMFLATTTDTIPLAQPITQAPMVFDHSLGGKLIVFGTGKLLVDADRATKEVQTMYSIWDKPSDVVPRPLLRASLVERELELVPDGAGGAQFYGIKSGSGINYAGLERGWAIDLEIVSGTKNIFEGERIIYPPQRVNSKLVLFSAVAPAVVAEICVSPTSTGANFILPVETGLNPTYKLFDVTGKLGLTDDPYTVGYATKVDGIDSIVRSGKGAADVADGICPAGFERTSIQNTTGQVMACIEIPPCTGASCGSVLRDRIQRRIINPPIR